MRLSPVEKVAPALTINLFTEPVSQHPDIGVSIPTRVLIWLNDPKLPANPSMRLFQNNFEQWIRNAKQRWLDRTIEFDFLLFNTSTFSLDILKEASSKFANTPNWMMNLMTDGLGLTSTSVLDWLLTSLIRKFVVYPSGRSGGALNHRILSFIKDFVDLRTARRQNIPEIICRYCLSGDAVNSEKAADDINRWLKQVGLDKLEITDKETEEQRLWAF
jgi:hypothetical protein